MIIETEANSLNVTLIFSKPINVFQEELLIETLKELSEINRKYIESYEEYL
jgi:hypothetical protein